MITRQKMLRWLMPVAEAERMLLREWLARASAECEDLNRTIILDADKIKDVLRKANGEKQ